MSGAASVRVVVNLGAGFARETPIADDVAAELCAAGRISEATCERVRLGVPYPGPDRVASVEEAMAVARRLAVTHSELLRRLA